MHNANMETTDVDDDSGGCDCQSLEPEHLGEDRVKEGAPFPTVKHNGGCVSDLKGDTTVWADASIE